MPSALAILAVTFAITCLCSLLEACVLSLSKSEIAALAATSPEICRIWTGFKERLAQPLGAILIVSTTAQTIGLSAAAGRIETAFGETGVMITSGVMAGLLVQWGEVAPKTLGSRHRRQVALVFGRALHAAVFALTPLVLVARRLNRPFEAGGEEAPPSIDEIRALAREARSSDVIGPADHEIIGRAAGLTSISVRDIMVPRGDISALSTSMSPAEALIHAHMDAHTRFPLCEDGRKDDIRGYINLKELVALLHTNPAIPTLRGIARPIHRVSPDTTASSLIRSFTKEHVHVAIVVDDNGSTLGMVTMEDLMEQLIGQVEDDFDRLPTRVHDLGGGVLMAGGGASARAVLETVGLGHVLADGNLSAFLQAKRKGRPQRGDEVVIDGVRFVVRRIRRGRVFDATVTRSPPDPSPDENASVL